jgi:hypothetical protein
VAAVDTDLSVLPVKPKAPRVAMAAPPSLSLDTAAEGLQKAGTESQKAQEALGTAETRQVTLQGKQQQEQSKYISGLHHKEEEELRGLDQGPFKPTENTLGNMAALFTMVGMLGAFMGGGRTTNAAASAQAALTGMMKGWNKGQDDLVAQQKAVFDENANYLKGKADQVRAIYKDYEEDALKVGIPTAQGRFIQRLLTEANADVPAARAKVAGAQAVEKQAENILRVSEAMESKRATLAAEQERMLETQAFRRQMAGGGFTPQMGDIMAALAERGVSLPTGLRSRQQQAALYQGLLQRHAGKSPDEIADLIKSGQIDLKSEIKETQTAAGIAGRIAVAENEIGPMGDLVMESANKVGRTNFLPVNRLLNTLDTNLNDPNLRALKVRITSLLNAYDVLAARGGTDMAKREEAHSLLSTADSPEALSAAVDAFKQEMTIAKRAATAAEHRSSGGAEPSEGKTSTSKSGKPIVFRNGQWEYQ